jgi:hypothetical protein
MITLNMVTKRVAATDGVEIVAVCATSANSPRPTAAKFSENQRFFVPGMRHASGSSKP